MYSFISQHQIDDEECTRCTKDCEALNNDAVDKGMK